MEGLLALSNGAYRQLVARQLRTEVVRKAIHLLIALVPLLAAIDVHFTVGLVGAGTLFYIFAENARMRGYSVILVSDLTLIASRDGDRGGFVLGPVTLGIGAMLALLLYPLEASVIAIYALAFGDAAASLIGKLVGGLEIPFTGGKTFVGSFACFAVVLFVSYRLTGEVESSLIIALSAMVFEALPSTDMDNVLLPVGTGFVAYHLLVL
jgi:phytol kinase